MASPDRFFGRYKVLEQVDRGAMGVIYRGVDSLLDREVAIKVMTADFSAEGGEEARARFFREAKAAARLQHRNIVTVFEFAEQDGVPYIVMEFLRGRSLKARIQSKPALSLAQKLDIMTQLCEGLQFAHENGVVHRDVKPANVWLLEDGSVKLVDFGIAKLLSSISTLRGEVMGSASYMSPEQIEAREVTGRSDVFSASIVLYELLASRKPFDCESPTATMMKIVREDPPPIETMTTGLPPELVAAVRKGLEKNPDRRFQTAGEFGTELQLIRMSFAPDPEELNMRFGTTTVDVTPPAGDPRTYQVDDSSIASASHVSSSRHLLQIGVAVGCAVLLVLGGWMLGLFGGTTGSNQSPPTAAQAILRVVSSPRDAKVTIDGVATDLVTPAEIKLGTKPPSTVGLTLKGYEPVTVTISAADIERGSIVYDFKPVSATTIKLVITGGYPFAVWDGGRLKSAASTRHDLTDVVVGRTLQLKAPEVFLDWPLRVDAGMKSVPAPGLGSISFGSSRETCRVVLDGRELDNPPFTQDRVAAGRHDVQLKCPGTSQAPSVKVVVSAGERQQVTLR